MLRGCSRFGQCWTFDFRCVCIFGCFNFGNSQLFSTLFGFCSLKNLFLDLLFGFAFWILEFLVRLTGLLGPNECESGHQECDEPYWNCDHSWPIDGYFDIHGRQSARIGYGFNPFHKDAFLARLGIEGELDLFTWSKADFT